MTLRMDDLHIVGYLVTHANGFEARLGPDRTNAELYAARNRGTLEPMYVLRRRRDDGGDEAPA